MRPLDAQVFAHGFSWRKRALVRLFTQRPDVRFVRHGAEVQPASSLLLWGRAALPAGLPEGVHVYRLEDGFVRSVGLGADLVRPVSWVVDDLGLYYDATTPSRLEHILQHTAWDAAALARARHLRERLLALGLTKYNLTGPAWTGPPGRPVVLVVGQVETDASVALGGLQIRSNIALLRQVRALRPEAWLVYKPHPDVVAGLRGAGEGEAQAASVCDEVLLGGNMHQILQQVDEVHVITSLTGFEALLRGKAVFCHGHPFYAGWGLTQDSAVHPRRSRRLNLDELVAGALLAYPRYADAAQQGLCTAEHALDVLSQRQSQLLARSGGRTPWWRRLLRPLLARP